MPEMSFPQRTCIGCRQTRSVAQLVRCRVSGGQSLVCGDAASRLAGRGAWLCAGSRACLDAAASRRAFDRALKQAVDASSIDALRPQFADGMSHAASVPQRRGRNMEQWRVADPVGRAAGTKG